MKNRMKGWLHTIISIYIKQDENQLILPQFVILTLQMQQAFLSLSYVYGKDKYNYIYFISMVIRPQQYLPSSEIIQYPLLLICVMYVLTILSIIPQRKCFGIFGQLLCSGLLNFFFEISLGPVQIATHICLILISFTQTILVQETLNVVSKNFQQTIFTIFDLQATILNYTIMILYSYQFSHRIIVILAIILNVLKIVSQYFVQSFQNYLTRTILLTIQICSLIYILHWLLELQMEISSLIAVFPLIYQIFRLYFSRQLTFLNHSCNHKKIQNIFLLLPFLENLKNLQGIQFEKPKNERDKIIYSSLLILQNKNYQAFIELNSISNTSLTTLERFKKSVIIKNCLDKIEQQILLSQFHSQSMANAITQLMVSEEQNQIIYNDVLKIINEKIECLRILLNERQTYSNLLQYQQTISNILNLKKKIETQYQNQRCYKNQNVLKFFLGEIINDYFQANAIQNEIVVEDEKLQRITGNDDNFSNQLIYLITQFRKDLIIKRSSHNAEQVLKVKNDQLIGQAVQNFIPPGMAEHHNQLILNFLNGKESTFLREFNKGFLYSHLDQYMSSVDLLFDITFIDEINFISFVQPATKESLSIVLNKQLVITCLSKQLLKELGISENKLVALHQHVSKIIRNFPTNPSNGQKIENAEIVLINDDKTPKSTNTSYFITTFTIKVVKFIHDSKYYILTFDSLKRQACQNSTSPTLYNPSYIEIICSGQFNNELQLHHDISPTPTQYQQKQTSEFINEESSINIPYSQEQFMKSLDQIYAIEIISPSQLNNKSIQEVRLLPTTGQTNIKTPQNDYLTELEQFQKSQGTLSFQVKRRSCFHTSSNSKKICFESAKLEKSYVTINKINYLRGSSKYHRIFLTVMAISIGLQLLIQIIQLEKLITSLKSSVTDIDLLQVKSFVYQPLETVMLLHWTLYNYNQLREADNVTQEEYTNLALFSMSNLHFSHNQLEINLKSIFSKLVVEEFFETTYLNVYEYVDNNTGECYNLSLGNSLSILQNIEYSSKIAQIDGEMDQDSFYVFYQYRNYLSIKSKFQKLNEQVYQDTISKSELVAITLKIVSFISFTILAFSTLISLYYYFKISQCISKQFEIAFSISPNILKDEIENLQKLSLCILEEQNILFNYQFRLSKKENIIHKSINRSLDQKRLSQRISINIEQNNKYYYLFFLFLFLLMVGNISVTLYEGFDYIQKYSMTAKFYKDVSDVGTDLPTMFAQREVLYNRKMIIPYLTETQCNDLLNEIIQALNRTEQFTHTDYDFDKLLVSPDFKSFYQEIQIKNLCSYLPDELANDKNNICQIAMNHNMDKGLSVILIYLVNHISTDMEINQFQKRTTQVDLDLEGAFLVSNIMKVINDRCELDFENHTEYHMNIILIHNVITFILLFFLIIFLLIYIKKKLKEQLYLLQRIVYLLPSKAIMLDMKVQTHLRQLLVDQ